MKTLHKRLGIFSYASDRMRRRDMAISRIIVAYSLDTRRCVTNLDKCAQELVILGSNYNTFSTSFGMSGFFGITHI